MTPLLQPLDTAVNRSFQFSYGIRYDSYIKRALNNKDLQKKEGNPKVLSYQDVTEWTLEWMSSVDLEILAKAFRVYGITHPSQFKVGNIS
jgi:hypothetical protein